MNAHSTHPLPGIYQYCYPTFVDIPQRICIHFVTADHQQAYVSYPNHPNHKAAQLISISWFRSVSLKKIEGEPRLMHFLEVILSGWLNKNCPKLIADDSFTNELSDYTINTLLAA